ncbi:unnamed protein product, partial [Owenia fusiformis]
LSKPTIMYMCFGVFVLFVVFSGNFVASDSDESCLVRDKLPTPIDATVELYPGFDIEVWTCNNDASKLAYLTCSTKIWSPEELQCGPGPDFDTSCLETHNMYRDRHQNTPRLTYNYTLAGEAKQWADYLPSLGGLQHGSTGENIYWASTSGKHDPCKAAVDAWYAEEPNWNYDTSAGNGGGVTGHFTQVVWKTTTEVGCGLNESAQGTYVVCRYLSPGNNGQYRTNVLKRL